MWPREGSIYEPLRNNAVRRYSQLVTFGYENLWSVINLEPDTIEDSYLRIRLRVLFREILRLLLKIKFKMKLNDVYW